MKKSWLEKQYRHVYRYVCATCGRIRFTYDKQRHDSAICTRCEPEKVHPDQGTLL